MSNACATSLNVHVSDIREATRSAVRNMIAYLVAEHGLDRVEAYILCSVAGDLKMHEVVGARVLPDPVSGWLITITSWQVDMPNYVVRISCSLPSVCMVCSTLDRSE